MAKKKCKNDGEKKNNDQQENNKKENGGQKDIGIVPVVLKIDLHCEGCATKVVKCIRCIEGVESVKGGDGDMNKLTVVGKVDPLKLRETVEQKTKKKVELISPQPKKDKDNNKEDANQKNKAGVGEGKKKNDNSGDKPVKQSDEKKSKEPPVTTAVLKVPLHCEGCVQKIHKVVSKTKGYLEMSIDRQKDLVTVKGAIDMKALAESLKAKLKKTVEIVPPKIEGESGKKGKGGGDSKNGGGEGGEVGGGGGGGGGGKAEKKKMEYGVQVDEQVEYPYPYPYPFPNVYGSGYVVDHVHAPQMFSDENPNACVVM